MLLRFPLTKILAPAALSLAAAFTATASGCSGCDDSSVTCDASGKCVSCDAYGCQQVDTGTTSSGGGNGQGGSGGTGTGGSGGAGPCDPEVAVCACEDGVCPDGLVCAGDLCVPGCDFSYECGPGKVCANGQCGVGCDANTPCVEPGTTCDKGVCVPDPQNPACDDQNPCPVAGEICVNGICSASCDANDDCPAGEVCNGSTGACIPDPSPQPSCGSVGAMCGGVGQVCMADGYCHYPCNTTQECKLIDNRFEACDQGICKTAEEINPECTLEMPCPDGLDCISNTCQ
jgi:hypothetical protein